MLKIKKASEGKVWAYKNDKGEEIILGNTLYLGINDDGKRYYEIEDINLKDEIIMDNARNEMQQGELL